MAATSTPQVIFTRAGGFGLPLVLMMPSTSVAESPEVTKNTNTSSVATIDSSPPMGMAWNITNMVVDTSAFTDSTSGTPWKISKLSAAPPNTENHAKPTSVGAITVPRMNWRIVRPRDTRAMNRPTNGDHASHQAQ
ncbi:hypothetical protein D9M72_232230 [compost metagenome]